jgi:hypothetical protein
MTVKINRVCSNCSSNETYTVKKNNSQHWYHSKITGQIICKRCYNNECYDSKPKIKDRFQNNFIRVTSYNESADSGNSFKRRKITWE